MGDAMTQKLRIRESVENWVLWRDAGDWDRFRAVWHEDGWMIATWFQGPAERIIEVSREGAARGQADAGTRAAGPLARSKTRSMMWYYYKINKIKGDILISRD